MKSCGLFAQRRARTTHFPITQRPISYEKNHRSGLDASGVCWWHWMNGNITKEGITKDLEWMNRVGIGGFQNFDASLFTPQVTP
jgi:hypothetical protein